MHRSETSESGGLELRAAARAALDLVGSDPGAALGEADRIVAAIPRQRSAEHREAASIAHRAAGLALYQAPDLVRAEARLRSAVREAKSAGLEVVAAEATMSLAFVLLERGRARDALQLLDSAAPRLSGLPLARLRAQRALVLHRGLGRVEDALEEFAAVIPQLDEGSDSLWLARAHNNRSQAHAYRGDVEAAIADLRMALTHFELSGQSHLVTQTASDLAWLVGVSGRIAESLRLMDEAAAMLPEYDPVAHLDRADILMRAGLASEAAETALAATVWLADRGWETLSAEAELLVAQSLLRSRDIDAALAHAATAASMFRASGRRSWLALARYVEHVAAIRIGTPRPSAATGRVIRELDARGWRSHALDLRVTAATAARSAGNTRSALALLGEPGADNPRDMLEVRSRSRHARALRATLHGETASAHRELDRAWHLGERQRALVGASELRALVAGHAYGVVALGLELARDGDRPGDVFRWAERGRAATLRFASAVPPDDRALAEALGHLRLAAYAEDQARLDGGFDPGASRTRLRCEREVLRLTRQTSGTFAGRRPVALGEVRERLGDATLWEYVVSHGLLAAVVVDRRRSRVVDIGSMSDIENAVSRLEFRLRRSAAGLGGSTAPSTPLLEAATEVDRLLFPPSVRAISLGRTVVSPTGTLWRVPWSLLPSLRGVPVSLAPSATVWCQARARVLPPSPRVLAVAGPRLEAAPREVRAVGAAYENSTVLLGKEATVASVSRHLTTVDIAHLATHGTLHRDNPLFSTLELADGPLMGFDLEGLPAMAHTVLLPACRSGEGRALADDEMLGLAWALLSAGASSVVATLTSVSDARTAELMQAVHRRLAAGDVASDALAAAQGEVPRDDALGLATAAAFVVTGC